MSELVLHVADLLRKPGSERSVHLESSIEELAIEEGHLPPGPVLVDVRLDSLNDGIVVSGTVRANWTGQCRRCLNPVGGPVDVPVQELYQARVSDPDAFPLEHDHLDLRPMVRESLLLDTPIAPLCRPDCAGICPTCGTDRNMRSCACATTARDDRWAALDALGDESR